MTLIQHDVMGAALLIAFLLGIIACSEVLIRRHRIAPETARKTIHLIGGIGCMFFPFLISSWITVLVLSAGFSIVLYLGESLSLLQSLGSVKRKSLGSLLFPISILILFVIAKDRLWLYLSSLFVLVLADTAAALAGTRYGSIFYQTAPNERKSLEGTFAFFLAGLVAVYVPLWTLSDIPLITCLLTAILMALLLAGLEAISIGGTDNLFVPMGALFLLWKIPDKPTIEILFQIASLIVLAFIIFTLNRRYKPLQMRPLIAFTLVTYAAWSLGSADWMIPLLVGYTTYNWICIRCAPRSPDTTALRLLRPLYPSLIILFCANAKMELAFWFGPFLAATTVVTSLCVAERFRRDPNGQTLQGGRMIAAILLPSTLSCLLCLPTQGRIALAALPALIPMCAVAMLIYQGIYRRFPHYEPWRYTLCICASFAALFYVGLQGIGALPPMDPSTWKEVFR